VGIIAKASKSLIKQGFSGFLFISGIKADTLKFFFEIFLNDIVICGNCFINEEVSLYLNTLEIFGIVWFLGIAIGYTF
jgi:hypothetical protein